jgi:CBS domain-containing protein
MAQEERVRQKISNRIDDLKALRDQIRVDLRLATMDLRDEWQNLENKLPNVDQIRGATGEVLERMEEELRRFWARLHASTDTATIAALMATPAVTCGTGETLARAVAVMWERDVGFLPVVDGDGRLVGTLTDRDAAVAASTRGLHLDEIAVESAMTRTPLTCARSDRPSEVMARLRERQLRRLPVVDGGRPVGVVTLTDLARAALRGGDPRDVVETLVAIGTRRVPQA